MVKQGNAKRKDGWFVYLGTTAQKGAYIGEVFVSTTKRLCLKIRDIQAHAWKHGFDGTKQIVNTLAKADFRTLVICRKASGKSFMSWWNGQQRR